MFEGRRSDETIRNEKAMTGCISFDQSHGPLRDRGVDRKDDDLAEKLADVFPFGGIAATDEEFHRRNDAQSRASPILLGRDERDGSRVATLGVDENVGVDQSCRRGR